MSALITFLIVVLQEVDLLNPMAPVYNEELAQAIRGLQKNPGPLMQGPCLLSGMTKQQHAWHVKNIGMVCFLDISLLDVALYVYQAPEEEPSLLSGLPASVTLRCKQLHLV